MSKSVFDLIKKQNGEAFAQAIRRFDSGIFDIPNLQTIVRYAGRNSLPLLDYLESLKEIEVELEGEAKDPFYLLDQAGYNAFYADTLQKQNSIAPYFEKKEQLCTFKDPDRFKNYYIIHAIKKNVDEIKRSDFEGIEEREDEYGTSVISIQILKRGGFISIKNRYNHTVNACDNTFYSNPDRIIEGLSFALSKHFKVDFAVKKQVFLPDDYILVNNQILKYDIEKNNVYFGDGFYVKDGVLHLVNKDSQLQIDTLILDLKTKEILNPSNDPTPLVKILQQEIENETLQVQNQNGIVSLSTKQGVLLTLKDRFLRSITLYKVDTLPVEAFYKHPMIEEVNALSVIACLQDALASCKNLKKVYLPKLEKNFHSSFLDDTDCVVDAPLLEENGIHFLRSTAFDLENQCFLTRGVFQESLLSLMERSIVCVEPRYCFENGEFITFLNEKPCFKFKEGKLVELTIFHDGKLKCDGVIKGLADLEVLNMPYVTDLSDYNIYDCPKLKKVYLPQLQRSGSNVLTNCDALEEVVAPCLEYMSDGCLRDNKSLKKLFLPQLREVKNVSCFSNSGYEEIDVPNLMRVGYTFCRNNKNLRKVHAPALKCVGEYCFSELNLIEELCLPELQYIEGRTLFSDNKNLKKVSFMKLMIIPKYMLKNCPKLEIVDAKALYRIENGALEEHPKLKHIYAPQLFEKLVNTQKIKPFMKVLGSERVYGD